MCTVVLAGIWYMLLLSLLIQVVYTSRLARVRSIEGYSAAVVLTALFNCVENSKYMAGYCIKLETSNQHEFNPILTALSTLLLFLAPFLDRLPRSDSPPISLHYITCRSNNGIPLVLKSSHLVSNTAIPRRRQAGVTHSSHLLSASGCT